MAKTFNGEHAKIYNKMEENHSEIFSEVTEVKIQLSRIETTLDFIKKDDKDRDKICKAHEAAIDWNKTKILLAIGGLGVFSFIVSTKAIGLW